MLIKDLGPHGAVKVTVKDKGIGIKREDVSKLFKLFGFLESSSRKNTQGIGLGLYICKKIVEQFEGTIEVKSEYNQGSEFSFTFMLSEI
jgi:signal transduction histidine kinase